VNISTATASNDKGNGIQIYDQAEAILENVTVSGFAKGGIYVRGTAVLSGTITTQ
jgi:putative cofactor-binding repeat protein